MSDRPFSILGVQQIAVGGQDKRALRRLSGSERRSHRRYGEAQLRHLPG